MLTVHPSIILGSYLWDEERLPRDEFDIRMGVIREAMAQRGWAGALVYGDAREHAALAYFTNFIPRMRWAMALIPAKGEPRLLASMSSRDIPAMRTMTWVPDVKTGWEWRWFDEWVATLGEGGMLGTMGLDLMTPLLFGSVQKTLGERFTLEAADDLVDGARAVHRPREIAILREAAGIARAAAGALKEAWARGDHLETAALAGERMARERAVHDVRTLVSRDGGRTFQPYAARFEDRPKHLLAYVAVKYLGYWADVYVECEAPEALRAPSSAALDGVIAGMQAGAPLAGIAAAAQGLLGGAQSHPALSGLFGRRIGLSLNEGGEIGEGGAGSVQANTVYSLHAGVLDAAQGGAIASALVLTRAQGAPEVLLRSEEA
jgi:Xaa-Pro aminopeptidase